jgi:hypothetical protein
MSLMVSWTGSACDFALIDEGVNDVIDQLVDHRLVALQACGLERTDRHSSQFFVQWLVCVDHRRRPSLRPDKQFKADEVPEVMLTGEARGIAEDCPNVLVAGDEVEVRAVGQLIDRCLPPQAIVEREWTFGQFHRRIFSDALHSQGATLLSGNTRRRAGLRTSHLGANRPVAIRLGERADTTVVTSRSRSAIGAHSGI